MNGRAAAWKDNTFRYFVWKKKDQVFVEEVQPST